MSHLTVFPLPPQVGCTDVDCSDPNSVLIHTLFSLGNSAGSTLEEIQSHIPVKCSSVSWSPFQLETYIAQALRRGILTTVGPYTYAVNAAMWRINPVNRKYYCICQLYRNQPL